MSLWSEFGHTVTGWHRIVLLEISECPLEYNDRSNDSTTGCVKLTRESSREKERLTL